MSSLEVNLLKFEYGTRIYSKHKQDFEEGGSERKERKVLTLFREAARRLINHKFTAPEDYHD